MKNYKEHVTKGPAPDIEHGSDNGWATSKMERDGLHVVFTAPNASEMENGEWDEPQLVIEMEANAKLFHEAKNVLYETGCTPRELAELVTAFRKLGDATEDFFQNMQEKGRGLAYRQAKQQAYDLFNVLYQPTKPVQG